MAIPEGLIRDELLSEANLTGLPNYFDPYEGQVLETVMRPFGGRTMPFLAFPMGNIGCELSELRCHLLNGIIRKVLFRYISSHLYAKERCCV